MRILQTSLGDGWIQRTKGTKTSKYLTLYTSLQQRQGQVLSVIVDTRQELNAIRSGLRNLAVKAGKVVEIITKQNGKDWGGEFRLLDTHSQVEFARPKR